MSEYSADEIQVLTAAEHIRKRSGMYVGETDSPRGSEHVVDELVANTLDLFLAGEASNVAVTVEGARITVEDDGPGIPFDVPSMQPGLSSAEVYLTQLHSGASAEGHAPHVHLVSLGVGLVIRQRA